MYAAAYSVMICCRTGSEIISAGIQIVPPPAAALIRAVTKKNIIFFDIRPATEDRLRRIYVKNRCLNHNPL